MLNKSGLSFVCAQVEAMEARAKTLGLPPKTLSYLWPQGPGDSPGRTDFAPTAADAKAINDLGLGTHILSDIHGPAMGGVAKAEQVFAEAATAGWGAMNLETNCGDHTMQVEPAPFSRSVCVVAEHVLLCT